MFVPAVLALMDDVGKLVWRVFSRFVGPTDEPAHEVARARIGPGQGGRKASAGRWRQGDCDSECRGQIQAGFIAGGQLCDSSLRLDAHA